MDFFKFRHFSKTVKRNDWTKIFGTPGRRRFFTKEMFSYGKITAPNKRYKKSKLNRIRRANTGWRNIKFGDLTKFKHFIKFGMTKRTTKSRFRR